MLVNYTHEMEEKKRAKVKKKNGNYCPLGEGVLTTTNGRERKFPLCITKLGKKLVMAIC